MAPLFFLKFNKFTDSCTKRCNYRPLFLLNIEGFEPRYSGGFTMTVENYNYRTSQIMLRNQFPGKGKL